MKAVILAAGEGARLRPLTDKTPKCLVDLDGKALLDWQIDAFKQSGVKDISVVKGYLSPLIQRPSIKFYVNESYASTNMVHSFWCAGGEFNDDVIVSYADIIYNADLLRTLIKSPFDITVLVDDAWGPYWKERFNDPLLDAETMKIDPEGKILNVGQRPGSLSEIEAQYIGLIKFNKSILGKVKESHENALLVEREGGKPWRQERTVAQAYMTDFLQGLIWEGISIHAVRVSGGWLEIDSLKDYELARKYIRDGEVCRK